jgi:formylglycine-generating enzyme required for sulfatase activity
MPKIFVSYRRADSAETTTRLYDRVVYAFGRENIFKDVDSIQRGDDFPEVLRQQVESCEVFLAVIGTRWLTLQDEHGRRRLDNPKDWVRRETEMALARAEGVIIIPTLVDGAALPGESALPATLAALATRDAQTLTPGKFHTDVSALITAIRRRFGLIDAAPPLDLGNIYRNLIDTIEENAWDAAREILAALRATGSVPAAYGLDDIEKIIYDGVTGEQRDRDYEALAGQAKLVAKNLLPIAKMRANITAFTQDYGDLPLYDTERANLRRFLATSAVPEDRAPVGPTAQPLSAPWAVKSRTPAEEATARVLSILPGPFAWCEIPAGSVTLIPDDADKRESYLKANTAFNLPAFMIAKYPTTHAQFARFIAAGGYDERRWWTDAGWEAKLQGLEPFRDGHQWKTRRTDQPWTQPRYWHDSNWNPPVHPVVGVSWYEAAAFCRWLSTTIEDKIALPTEQMWQRAAQGGDDRAYPWGNDWDGARCNNSVDPFKSNATTRVMQFEGRGDSPFGVVDLVGNVCEWCIIDYQDDRGLNNSHFEEYGVRGGAWWNDNTYAFRTISRIRVSPSFWYDAWGFRAART